MGILTKELSIYERQQILKKLFGFHYVDETDENDVEEHWVLYDEDDREFYGDNKNLSFDFSTLAGIFAYAAHRAKNQGYQDCQMEIKRALGL